MEAESDLINAAAILAGAIIAKRDVGTLDERYAVGIFRTVLGVLRETSPIPPKKKPMTISKAAVRNLDSMGR